MGARLALQALARCEAKDLHWMPDALAEILTISDEEKIGDGEKNREDIDQLIDLGRKIPLGNTGDRTRRVFEKELTRLSQLEPSSQEYAVTRQYLDVVLSLPWTSTEGVVDLSAVRSSLSATHYGLEEVKERVVELWALGKMSHPSTRQVRPLLLVGPPGCGKTSIAGSIAKALGRRFEMVSLGGLSDAGELKVHRRTYIRVAESGELYLLFPGIFPGKGIKELFWGIIPAFSGIM
ncbi:hypothetical protein Pmar_PMAR029473 [Perkinsus marinus ATCC 50983]|uniref:ATPase AAA-type core domain-containing protein n=1 Tax=Perkinsus marinus (strain ATCC 50983 / TXsc) TaxID=423536 RepID=C5KGS2_PERM5|nr:hypothetical protein Pmar_PMAR029473 [Perkinsus marinus ATCC 50983]EER16340.1 hypothetical protein Pmar_PMAR029473 [Perkinsus marinus ATCC 50983]|eukprot:XP_002784544.1 hypothetical protein Pmar_PMAR029473 [Perkinsus marinus ATCC 50983]